MSRRPGPEQKGFDFEEKVPAKDFPPSPATDNSTTEKKRRKTYGPEEECPICGLPKNNCPHYGEVKKPKKPWEKHL